MDVLRSLKASKSSAIDYMKVWCPKCTFEMVDACVPFYEFTS
jgi:hypothetical protein